MQPDQRAFLAAARTGTLATIAHDGLPRLVPVCFALAEGAEVLYSPLDDKPKRPADPRHLARVRDILVRPDVSLLVHHWSEDWSALGWLRIRGRASLLEPAGAASEHAAAVGALREKYPQYADHRLEARPIIRVAVVAALSWGSIG
ncbi:MAG TPA: TIGR03668 family PPOX class F420-dependent oxidoreductase [Candidatus Limnocylindrales bacterium]|nr:TIGR03668 family PPOX class F420-dependent oxidoreductase [Candidatus Limnocylindrales bacterium]